LGTGAGCAACTGAGRGMTVAVGVIGVGSLGQHHARVYADLPAARLVGVHDLDPRRAAEIASRHGCRAFEQVAALLDEVQAVSVAVPTVAHHAVAGQALLAGRDVLVEKPMTASVAEAEELLRLAGERGAILQV